VDDVARPDELPSPRDAYEPPRLDELGEIAEFTAGQTDNASVLDGNQTT